MNPWIAKAVILAASVVMVAIRAPHGRRSRGITVVTDRKGRLEVILLVLAMLGFFVPLVWIVSPLFSLAEYPLRRGPLLAGVACFVVGLWLFYRSHADLGTNWSITAPGAEAADFVVDGVYRRIRHPMSAALIPLFDRAGARAAKLGGGSFLLVTFVILLALRVHAEADA